MIFTADSLAPSRVANRAALAAERAPFARLQLSSCKLCAHRCGVNRLEGQQGLCHASTAARVFSSQTEVSDELDIIPTFAIAFSGCDLRCSFCITGKESWNSHAGQPFNAESLTEQAASALSNGAQSIMILGGEPTIHLPSVLELVALLPTNAKLIWKTNGHASAEARELLDGLFDLWLVDYKFGNDWCAQRLASVPNYQHVIRENLLWANKHNQLLVRHLIMPGHVDCCWRPAAEWIAHNLPDVKVNLRSGFWPAWKAMKHPELCRTTSLSETRLALDIAREFNLHLVE